MRFLLRPAWLALITTVTLFVIACYALLAPWQFGREAQRDAEQHTLDAASAIPPAPLAQVLPTGGVAAAVDWRQVTVTGTYLPEAEGVVRLRVYDGKPAFEVLTPFRATDGRVVAIDRGFVTAENGAVVPPYPAPPTGEVTISARLRLDKTDPDHRAEFYADGHRQLYVTDSRTLAAATGLPIAEGYLALADGQPGVLNSLPVEPAAAQSAAPFTNFSYALQWLTFGAIAVFALVYFVRLEMLQRRSTSGAMPRRSARQVDRAAFRRELSGEDDDRPDAS
ncbi:MAG: SURF1 family protein [Pseudonocardiales bacterium]|nr:SURF1 family protein [Pseudonocardiales bacterium]